MGETPAPGWTTRGIISRVLDGETQDIGDSFSMGRAVGRVWINGTDLSALQVRKGYATREKGGGK